MENNREPAVFTRLENPLGWWVLFAVFAVPLLVMIVWIKIPALPIVYACILLLGFGWLLFETCSKITITEEWVTFSIGKIVWKRVAVDCVRLIAKTRLGAHANSNQYQLVVVTIPAAEIEASGEKSLLKKPVVKSEIAFRKNRSDWKDICLEVGLTGKRLIRMEYTPQRQQALRELFPNAEYREGKHYEEPPSLV